MRHAARRRRGQALVEFSVIALFFAIMIGGMLSFGHMFFVANSLQQAVDVGAQEIARMPLPAAAELGLGFETDSDSVAQSSDTYGQIFRSQIYDEKYLVIHKSELNGQSLIEFSGALPLLNRLLVTSMIWDPSYSDGVYRFPGAIVSYSDPNGAEEETVVIPLLGDDQTVARWVKPVEEIRGDPDEPTSGPFSVIANVADGNRGLVSLRINYPAQAAGLVQYVKVAPGSNIVTRVAADDTTAENAPVPGGKYSLAVSANSDAFDALGTSRVNSGRFGLGRTASYMESAGSLGVRPYRRVISVQAIYRREVFE